MKIQTAILLIAILGVAALPSPARATSLAEFDAMDGPTGVAFVGKVGNQIADVVQSSDAKDDPSPQRIRDYFSKPGPDNLAPGVKAVLLNEGKVKLIDFERKQKDPKAPQLEDDPQMAEKLICLVARQVLHAPVRMDKDDKIVPDAAASQPTSQPAPDK